MEASEAPPYKMTRTHDNEDMALEPLSPPISGFATPIPASVEQLEAATQNYNGLAPPTPPPSRLTQATLKPSF